MNTLHDRYKIFNFTLTVSLIATTVSAVLDDCGRWLPAVRLIELVGRNFCRKSCRPSVFFQFLLGYSLMSLWATDLYVPACFDQSLLFKTERNSSISLC